MRTLFGSSYVWVKLHDGRIIEAELTMYDPTTKDFKLFIDRRYGSGTADIEDVWAMHVFDTKYVTYGKN